MLFRSLFFFFFSSRRRHTRSLRDWSSDVCSSDLGPVGYPEGGSVFLGSGGPGMSSRPFAEATQAEIDREVAMLLREAEKRAVELLTDHRSVLDALTGLLLESETVDGSEVYRLAGLPDRSATPPSVAAPATVAPRAVATADASHQDSAV